MRRFPWRFGLVAVAVVLAAAWVTAPWREKSQVPLVRTRPVLTSPAPATPAKELGKYADPIRYAYSPPCHVRSDACDHWILVSASGERGWLPYGSDAGPFGLSPDGLRAAYLGDERYRLADLRRGTNKPLPIKEPGGSVGTVFGAQPPVFSPDGRHVLIQPDHLDEHIESVLEEPLIVDAGRGKIIARLHDAGHVAGWTSDGPVMATSARTDDSPGHVTSTTFTVYSTKGAVIRRFTMPGDLVWASTLSPSGRTIATLHREITPDDVSSLGVALYDTAKGKHVRTVVPRLPDGWRVTEILRWEGRNALVVRAHGPGNEIAYQVLDLGTATLRPLDVTTAVADHPLQPAEEGVILGSVR